ncbi:alpha-amylase [Candidatus Woesearchaeota archaeon CG08_land_8_20_14_0_20_47_9]|nr:MAG: alpha-amylase [Candidatus Woesearchaeota archaeon CG1_02_47_18]PIN72057.1 MAG: alpha-amylase [Candidatus Woesearchaeota archaeon CG10_big_fil_rev_8_21_14_0_10_47_5]PIO03085.1 MAG: alpha-amylase [Candidatus Woesearchaeota archaeon CG08_land_8_20_14_0_20_47_9]HII29610.1 alpha-amylase [Candidatus Woesearchaeota archaeon]
MVSVCFYFQVHQPYRLRRYSVFEIGRNSNYFNEERNMHELRKIAEKCYLPANMLMLELLNRHKEFRIAYSFSGVVLEQFEQSMPDVLRSFQDLASTGRVEILDETYYHSLSFLYSKDEFRKQVALHRAAIKRLFNYSPQVFRNTELVYNNELAHFIEEMGYKGILAEGADHILGWRSPNFIYKPKTTEHVKLLLKNYKLSDDIAFRFSNRGWEEWPLTAPKFSQWVSAVNGNGQTVNLFMDYETFGEHQWEDTGIFEFMRYLPGELLKHPDNNFKTPSEVIDTYPTMAELDMHSIVSWADIERDLSAWLGNNMQQSAINKLYALERAVIKSRDKELIKAWRRLQISDHFYYMCTKWFNDGDVHKYFNPHDSPYEAFISFMNVLNDLEIRARKALRKSSTENSVLDNRGAGASGSLQRQQPSYNGLT